MKTTAQLNRNTMNHRIPKTLYNEVLDVFRKVFEEAGHPFRKK